jgi:hypothetical protein
MQINYLEGLLLEQGKLLPPPEYDYLQKNEGFSFEELVMRQQGSTNAVKIGGPYAELRLPWLREMSRYVKNAENNVRTSVTFLNDAPDDYNSQEINRVRLWWAWHLMYTILSDQHQVVPFDGAVFTGWVESYQKTFDPSDVVAELPESIRAAYQVIWATLSLYDTPEKCQADNFTNSFLSWLYQGFQTTQWNGVEGEAVLHTLVVDAAWELVTTLLATVPQDQRGGFGLPPEVFQTFYDLPTVKANKAEVKRIPLNAIMNSLPDIEVSMVDKLPKTGVMYFGDREAVPDKQ